MTSNTIINSSNSNLSFYKSCKKKKVCNIKINEKSDLKDNSRNIVVGSIGNMISDFSEKTIISFLLANNFKIVKNSKAESKIKSYLSKIN